MPLNSRLGRVMHSNASNSRKVARHYVGESVCNGKWRSLCNEARSSDPRGLDGNILGIVFVRYLRGAVIVSIEPSVNILLPALLIHLSLLLASVLCPPSLVHLAHYSGKRLSRFSDHFPALLDAREVPLFTKGGETILLVRKKLEHNDRDIYLVSDILRVRDRGIAWDMERWLNWYTSMSAQSSTVTVQHYLAVPLVLRPLSRPVGHTHAPPR